MPAMKSDTARIRASARARGSHRLIKTPSTRNVTFTRSRERTTGKIESAASHSRRVMGITIPHWQRPRLHYLAAITRALYSGNRRMASAREGEEEARGSTHVTTSASLVFLLPPAPALPAPL